MKIELFRPTIRNLPNRPLDHPAQKTWKGYPRLGLRFKWGDIHINIGSWHWRFCERWYQNTRDNPEDRPFKRFFWRYLFRDKRRYDWLRREGRL